MGSAEMLVWMSDFNYRIQGRRDAVVSTIRRFVLKGDQAALQQLLAQVRCVTTSVGCRSPGPAGSRTGRLYCLACSEAAEMGDAARCQSPIQTLRL